MTQFQVKNAPFNFSEECILAFDTLKRELTQAPIMIKPDWSLPFEIMCDASDYAVGAEFDIEICDKKDLGKLTKAGIRTLFPEERSMAISNKNNKPWWRGPDIEALEQLLRQGPQRQSEEHHASTTTARKVFEAGFLTGAI
ncbi:reverse transcriptase domain-containing protein [Tanacetum coccineum]